MVHRQETLPSYREMSIKFDRNKQLPQKSLESFFESQKRRILNLISWLKAKIFAISSVSEYDTGKRMIWVKNGEKMQYDHIKDGSKTSTTTILFSQNRLKGRLNFHEITATDNFGTDSKTVLQHTLKSEHSHMENTGVQRDIITESVLIPDGVEYSKTQDFCTGETVFREEKGGIRREWTFDKNKRLVSSYEGYFQDEEWKGIMVEKKYDYTKTRNLKSVHKRKIKITPDGEKISEKIDVFEDKKNILPRVILSLLSKKSYPSQLDDFGKKQYKEKIFKTKLVQNMQDKVRR